MTTTARTYYGELIGKLARDYETQTSALHRNTNLINRFGEFAKSLELTPHVRPLDNGTVSFVARCDRGRDHLPVLAMLRQTGCKIGEPEKPALQIRDTYTAWTASVTSPAFSFTLLFYVEEDVS